MQLPIDTVHRMLCEQGIDDPLSEPTQRDISDWYRITLDGLADLGLAIVRESDLTDLAGSLHGAVEALTALPIPTVGHIDDTPARPLNHHRFASELVGNELVERNPGEWVRLRDVVQPSFDGSLVGCFFEDGSKMWVGHNSTVHVRHDPNHPAVVREGLAKAREALRSAAPQDAA